MDRTKMKTAGKDFKGGIGTKRVKSGTKAKTKARSRSRSGKLQKSPEFKPFMA